MVLLAMLASGGGAWAASGPGPRRGTVPTPTPRVTPTKPPTPTPVKQAAPPTPTRIIPPTRTPCLNCPTPAAISEDAQEAILVNVGGGEYTDSASQVWQADQEYAPGLTLWGYVLGEAESGSFAGDQPVKGTTEAALYQDERWGMAGYRFEVANGRYQVTLKFVEQFVKGKGERVFAVRIQDEVVLPGLDLIAAAGEPLAAIDRVFTVTVSSRLLAIDFISQIENPTLSAIAVRPIGSPALPTPTPAPTETTAPSATATSTATSEPSVTATATSSPTTSPTATSLPASARSVALFPQAAAALRSSDGVVLAHVPAKAVAQATMLVYLPENSHLLPPANPGFRLGSTAFTLDIGAGSLPPTPTLLMEAMTVTVRYAADDLQAAQRVPSRLVLARYRPEAGQWFALETWADAAAGTISGRTRQMGLFTVLIHTPAAPAPASVDVQQRMAVGAAVLLLAGVVAVLAARKWRRRLKPRRAQP